MAYNVTKKGLITQILFVLFTLYQKLTLHLTWNKFSWHKKIDVQAVTTVFKDLIEEKNRQFSRQHMICWHIYIDNKQSNITGV